MRGKRDFRIPCGDVVAAVDDDIVLGDELNRVLGREEVCDGRDVAEMIDFGNAFLH